MILNATEPKKIIGGNMSKFKNYMNDRSVENSLSEKERENRVYKFYQGLALSRMEGEEFSKEEEEYSLYCALNDVPIAEMLDAVFEVNGWEKLDHDRARATRLEYEKRTKAG